MDLSHEDDDYGDIVNRICVVFPPRTSVEAMQQLLLFFAGVGGLEFIL
jgi:hypothetical protein